MGEIAALFRRAREGNRFRVILNRVSEVDPLLTSILRELRQDGLLRFEGFARAGIEAVTIEVCSERAKEKVELGRSSLSMEESRVVKVKVRGSRWW